MEWSKIKTILIWIFAIVNIFLFSMFFKDIYVGTELSDDVVKNTIEILKKNNVSITAEVMPKDCSDVRICNVENEYNSISEMLESIRSVSTKNGVSYFSEENVDVKGKSFTCTVNSDEKVSNTLKHTKSEIKKTGLLDDVEYSIRESGDYVYFYLKNGNMIFFDSYVRVKCTQKGIQEIYANNWFGDKVTEGGTAETISPSQILIDFAVEKSYTEKVTVKSVEAGYYVGNRDETVSVTAFPVWEISVSDGGVYYYDRRNGDLVSSNK